jgi:hypothetical protein
VSFSFSRFCEGRKGADIHLCDSYETRIVPRCSPTYKAPQTCPALDCSSLRKTPCNHRFARFQTRHTLGIHFATQNIIAPDMTELVLQAGASVTLENRAGETTTTMATHVKQAMESNRQHMQLIANAEPSNAANVAALATTQTALDRANKCLELLNNCSRGFCAICSKPIKRWAQSPSGCRFQDPLSPAPTQRDASRCSSSRFIEETLSLLW